MQQEINVQLVRQDFNLHKATVCAQEHVVRVQILQLL